MFKNVLVKPGATVPICRRRQPRWHVVRECCEPRRNERKRKRKVPLDHVIIESLPNPPLTWSDSVRLLRVIFAMAPFDLDACIEQLLRKQLLHEALLREICEKTKEVLMRESNVVHVSAPVTVVGDIHGCVHLRNLRLA
jgi:hypothetical protein